MSERRIQILLPVGILLLGAILTVVLVKSRRPVPTRAPQEYAPFVRVTVVEPAQHQLTVTTHGTVKPRTESALVSEVAGRVVSASRSFASGGYFEKDEVMLEVDPRDYELALVTARSQVAQAKVRAQTEEARAEVAREEWATLGGGTDSPLATRELQMHEAQSALEAAEALLEVATRNLDRTRIRAPFACRVRGKLVDVGQYVTPGVPVANIFAIDYVEVRLPIPDAELAFLNLPFNYRGEKSETPGPLVTFRADFGGAPRQWQGQIVRVEGEIDPVSRVVHAVAQVHDPYGRRNEGESMPLAVGLFVEAEISGIVVEDAVVLPRSAVRMDGTVLIVDDDDRLRFRTVEVLRRGGSSAVIAGGLRHGERVLISTLEAVTDGMKVRISDGSAASAVHTPEVQQEATTIESGDDS